MKKVVVALLLLMFALVGGGWYAAIDYLNTPNKLTEVKTVEIPRGTSMLGAFNILEQSGVISRAQWLYYYDRATKKTSLKAGFYQFPAGITPLAVLEMLKKGETFTPQVAVTIPEGLNIFEIFPLLEKSGIGVTETDLMNVCKDPAFLREQEITGPTCEGYLFPETYYFDANGGSGSAKKVLSRMTELFRKNFTQEIQSRGAQLGLSPLEIVTMASIIQKETGIDSEMPHISSVFHNRLSKGMKLQTDPTVIYAKILDLGKWDGNITKKDLERRHPYNTYTSCTALPPGPIACPGRKALEAAVAPITSTDLYFMATGDGGHEFCPTLSCHNEALKRYLRKIGHIK